MIQHFHNTKVVVYYVVAEHVAAGIISLRLFPHIVRGGIAANLCSFCNHITVEAS